jgi:SAM-dependent methyltransferase
VSFLCSALVGPTGDVVGVDRDPAVIARARQRLQEFGASGVTFVEADYRELADQPPFDAVIGRAVLMYAADPAAALRSLLPHLKSGGIVAFQEFDFTHLTAMPMSDVYRSLKEWWRLLGERSGLELHMGYKLFPAYRAAGLPDPTVLSETIVGGGPDFAGYAYLAGVFRSVLPLLVQLDIATAAEVDVETLADRLRDATIASGGVVALQSMVGAVSRKP